MTMVTSVKDADVVLIMYVVNVERILNMSRLNFLKIRLLTDTAQAPKRATSGSSGADLHSDEDVVIPVGHQVLVGTGLALDTVPEFARNLDLQIRSRSGLAANHAVFVLNAPGTIDIDYRGEIKVLLMNLGDVDYKVSKGDRIAQLVIGTLVHVPVISTRGEPLVNTGRGTGGFGSTGK